MNGERRRKAKLRRLVASWWFVSRISKRKQKRRFWMKPWLSRRENLGAFETLVSELRQEDEPSFLNFLRLSPEIYDELLAKISPYIERQSTKFRKAIPPGLRLSVTLRYLATGDTYRSLGYLFRIGSNTIGKIVPETCRAIYEVLRDKYMKCPSTEEEWKDVSAGFWNRWNFPNCLGAIDGKHVALRQPACSGSKYFNYKHSFSIVLLALVDSQYKFLFCDIGTQGRISDGGVFAETQLKRAIEDNSIGIPPPAPFPGAEQNMPYCIVGDEAFPLKNYLQKPFPQRNLSREQRVYNYRLSRARRCVENAFGILANRFRVFLQPICLTPTKVETLVMAACALHNMLRTLIPASYLSGCDIEDPESHANVPGSWRSSITLESAQATSRRCVTKEAQRMREYICEYFNSEAGSVDWQENMI